MKINISHIAFGSFINRIGAATLGSSDDVSANARNVNGIYIDEEHRLSSNYSSLLWEYCEDTDRYMLVHVQGNAVEDTAMARFFSYRDASEVKRKDVMKDDVRLAEVFDAMPRMEDFTSSRDFPLSHTLSKHVVSAQSVSKQLANVIYASLAEGRQLYVAMSTKGRELRGNGVFDTPEWNTLIEAIDWFPTVAIRQQLTFAFCVDQNYTQRLADKAIVFYVAESSLKPAEGSRVVRFEQLSAEDASLAVQQALKQDSVLFNSLHLAASKPDFHPRPFPDFVAQIKTRRALRQQVLTKTHAEFTSEEYQMWRDLGNTVNDLKPSNWQEYLQVISLVGGATSADGKQLCLACQDQMSHWTIEGMSLDEKKQLLTSGVMEKNGFIALSQKIWNDEYEACGKDDVKIIKCIKDLLGYVSDDVIISSLAQLSPEKDASLVESLLKLASDMHNPLALRQIINTGLERLAETKSQKMGVKLDKWLKFFVELNATVPRELSRILYLTQLRKDFSIHQTEWTKELGTYAKKNLREPRRVALSMIKEFLDVAEDSSSLHLSGRKRSEVKTQAFDDDDSADEEQFISYIRKWLKQIKHDHNLSICSIFGAVVATSIVAIVLWFFSQCNSAGSEPNVEPLSVSPVLTSRHVMAHLSMLRPEVKQACVGPDTINIDDIQALARLDEKFTKNVDTASFQPAKFITFYRSGDIIEHDTLLVDAFNPLLRQVLERPNRIHQVLLTSSADTICIDIPNTAVFDHLYPDTIHRDLTTPVYYLWCVAQIEDSLAAHGQDCLLAY